MAEKFIVQGMKPLKGTIEVNGSKNSATPILAATLLTSEPCIIENVPLVADVLRMIEMIQGLGADIRWMGERTVRIEAKDIDPDRINQNLVCKLRSSILLTGPLLARCGHVKISHPGGCFIGARPIDTHLAAFKKMGIEVETEKLASLQSGGKQGESKAEPSFYSLKVKSELQGGEIVLREFSVTATENILMTSALLPERTIIKIAATEPHVQDLACFLKKMGADIRGEGTNTIEVKGQKRLHGARHSLIYDPVEAGTFVLMALAGRADILVKNASLEYLDLFLEKLREFGGNFKILNNNSIKVESWKKLKIDKIQALPYPGIPTDLQSAFGVLATQSEGSTLIHDPLYEGRLKYLEELNKMGAEIIICDPHRAIINGPTQLYGAELGPLDLRGGAALIIAGLIAKGTTIINDIYQIDRGYEKIEERLQRIGADIRRVKE